MDISCERQKLFGFQHFNRFFTNRSGGLFQVKLFICRKHKNIVLSGFSRRNKRFEYALRFLPQNGGNLRRAQRICRRIIIWCIRYFFTLYYPHYICLKIHLQSHTFHINIKSVCTSRRRPDKPSFHKKLLKRAQDTLYHQPPRSPLRNALQAEQARHPPYSLTP